MALYTRPPEIGDIDLSNVTAPIGDVTDAIYNQHGLGSGLVRELDKAEAARGDSPKLDRTAIDAKLQGTPLEVPDGIREDVLDLMLEDKRKELRRNELVERSDKGLVAGTLKLTAGLAASLTDPGDLALSMVPVVGQAKYAKLLGAAKGAGGRALVRAKVGAAGGAVGTALGEPFMAGFAHARQENYTLQDSFINVTFGTIMGGGLHVAGGAVKDSFTKGPLEGAVDAIIGVESGGRASAKNPNSTATGAGQFIKSTWLGMMKKYRPDKVEGLSEKEILDLRTDKKLSKEMTTRYAEENAALLADKGLPVNAVNVYIMHHFGPDGARILSKAPDTLMADIVSKEIMDANPHLKGKTLAEVRDSFARRMAKHAPRKGLLRRRTTVEDINRPFNQGESGRIRTETPVARSVDAVQPEVREHTLRTATSQFNEGKRVTITSVLDTDPRYQYFRAKESTDITLPEHKNLVREVDTAMVRAIDEQVDVVARGAGVEPPSRTTQVIEAGRTPTTEARGLGSRVSSLESKLAKNEGSMAELTEIKQAREQVANGFEHPDDLPPFLRKTFDDTLSAISERDKPAKYQGIIAEGQAQQDFNSYSLFPDAEKLDAVGAEVNARANEDVVPDTGAENAVDVLDGVERTPEVEARLKALDEEIKAMEAEAKEMETALQKWKECRATNG